MIVKKINRTALNEKKKETIRKRNKVNLVIQYSVLKIKL